MYIVYRSYQDLANILLKSIYKIPHDVDIVVGIPRSGMLPATIIALYLNRPVTDLDSFIEGRVYETGNRGGFISPHHSSKVIIIDDSISSGQSLFKTKEKIARIEKSYSYIYVAVFASSKGKKLVDLWFEEINMPRVFQWNIFHHKYILGKTCMDIDGVLCPNPSYDDDGDVYVDYIEHASPMIIPSVIVDTLVTCRLEKYRGITETWLSDNGVKYNKLLMLNMASKEERQRWGRHGEFKGQIYKKSSCQLFVESSLKEAIEICNVSGKQVFCIETMEMIYGKRQFADKIETALLLRMKSIIMKIIPSWYLAKLRKNTYI